MLLEQTIEIKWHIRNKSWYASKGYKFTRLNDIFDASVFDLPHGTKEKIKVKCDYCEKIVDKIYRDYIKSKKKFPNFKDSCKLCRGKKVKEYGLSGKKKKTPKKKKDRPTLY